jgi:hypothetical protein
VIAFFLQVKHFFVVFFEKARRSCFIKFWLCFRSVNLLCFFHPQRNFRVLLLLLCYFHASLPTTKDRQLHTHQLQFLHIHRRGFSIQRLHQAILRALSVFHNVNWLHQLPQNLISFSNKLTEFASSSKLVAQEETCKNKGASRFLRVCMYECILHVFVRENTTQKAPKHSSFFLISVGSFWRNVQGVDHGRQVEAKRSDCRARVLKARGQKFGRSLSLL